jgi:hypothetical protein
VTRGACNFRERDLRAAIKAAQEAGVEIGRIEVDSTNGKIIIIPSKEAAKSEPNSEVIL